MNKQLSFEQSPDDLVSLIIESAREVIMHLGSGHSESTYQCALEVELQRQTLFFVRSPSLSIYYKGNCVGFHKPDLIIQNLVIVELKCTKSKPTESSVRNWVMQLDQYVRNERYRKDGLILVFGAENQIYHYHTSNNKQYNQSDQLQLSEHDSDYVARNDGTGAATVVCGLTPLDSKEESIFDDNQSDEDEENEEDDEGEDEEKRDRDENNKCQRGSSQEQHPYQPLLPLPSLPSLPPLPSLPSSPTMKLPSSYNDPNIHTLEDTMIHFASWPNNCNNLFDTNNTCQYPPGVVIRIPQQQQPQQSQQSPHPQHQSSPADLFEDIDFRFSSCPAFSFADPSDVFLHQ